MGLIRPTSNKKRALPRGWVYPISPAEIRELLPRVGYISWSAFPALLRDYNEEYWVKVPHFALSWDPKGRQVQPRLSVRPVLTEQRAEVRSWCHGTVIPEARAWLTSLDRTSEVALEKEWSWPTTTPESRSSTR